MKTIVAIGTHNLRKGYQFEPKMMRTNSKNRICNATNEIVENALKKAHLFSFWWGRWGRHCVSIFFLKICVPMCSHMFPKFLMCSQQHHTFLFHVVCQRRGITSSYRNFYFGSSEVSFFFWELMGQSKWFSAIKIILNAQIMWKNLVCEQLPLHIELLVYS